MEAINKLNQQWRNEAMVFFEKKQYDKTIPLLAQIAQFFEQSRTWEDYVDVGNKWAESLMQMGRHNEALQVIQKVVQIGAHNLNSNSELLGKSYYVMGRINQEQEECDKAIGNYQNCLNIYLQTLDKNAFQIANVYERMGISYRFKGMYDTAILYYKNCLSARLNIFGGFHINVAHTYTNLGNTYFEKKDLESAIIYATRSLQIKQQLLGEMNTDTASSYSNLGVFYYHKKNYEEAILCQEKSLHIITQLLGEQHIRTAYTYSNFGLIFYKMKQYEEAMQYFSKAIQIIQNYPNQQQLFAAYIYRNIATILSKKQQYDAAIECLQKSSACMRKIAEKHPDIAIDYFMLADIYAKQHKYNAALPYYQLALQTNSEDFNSNDIYLNPPLDGHFSSVVLLETLKYKTLFLNQYYRNKTQNYKDLEFALDTAYLADNLIEQMRKGYLREKAQLLLDENAVGLSEVALDAIWLLQTHST
jgi:tetratricopeptide (TPR) repeat protein